jgi:[ribosomal protein S18]-alanine N-acetyltransferase
MAEEQFAELATYEYEPPYDFYDGDAEPVLNPERYFAVLDDDGELVGHYYFEPHGDVLDYGLGLRPGLVGRGHGLEFFRVGLEFGRSLYAPKTIQLHVAAFNVRAITVYERAGFREVSRHVRHSPRFGDVEFITMVEQ